MPLFDAYPALASLKGISMNAASNNFIAIPSGGKRVLVTKVTVTNASATMAGSTGTLGVSVSSGGSGAPSGVVIVTAATGVVTNLTGSTITFNPTIPASALAVLVTPAIPTGTNPQTGMPFNEGGFYINVAGTPNVAGTVDVYIFGDIYD